MKPNPQPPTPNPQQLPDPMGRFGPYGGRFAPETLMAPLEDLEKAYREAKIDPAFQAELQSYLKDYAGRPTPLYFAKRLSERFEAKVYLKREDLCHTGAHKINNTLGQVLLAKRMGKKRVIAETGAGQHGVATATAAALFGLECEVYMGTEDMKRQELNVFRMRLLGAKVTPVDSGSRTLKDAITEAMRDWVAHVDSTHYVLGSALGPHPYPMIVRDFQSVIGREAKAQILEAEGRLPDYLLACVGGGSNAIGLFCEFLDDPVKMIGVEAGGLGIETGKHAARFATGRPGVLHGSLSFVLQDEDGQILTTHSVSAGLDYPGVGPEHSFYRDLGRIEYVSVTDEEALRAFQLLSELEGIIPALEPAHAIAYAAKFVPTLLQSPVTSHQSPVVLINLSGRGDKDVQVVADLLGSE